MQRPLARGMGFFSLIWLGELVSLVGSGMTGFAVGISMFQETGSVTLYALIGLSIAVPTILLSPLAGAVADRFDRRLVLLLSTLGSALGTLVLYALVERGLLTSWGLYPIVAVKAAFSAFVWPTFSAATTLIVGRQHFGRASGMTQMGAAMSQILAPLAAGVLVEAVGVGGVILIDIASFFAAATSLLIVRFPQPPAAGTPAAGTPAAGTPAAGTSAAAGPAKPGGMWIGWTFVRERPGLLWLMLFFAALNLCIGIIQVLITPMVLSFASPRTLGAVLAVAAGGSLVGGILMSVWGGPPAYRRIAAILAVMVLEGVFLMLGGLQANATLIASAAFFFTAGFPIVAGTSQAIWQTKTPPEIQGRVFAMRRLIASGIIPLAYVAAGPLADFAFEPLLAVGGPLAGGVVGQVLGVGPGRGMGLMLVVGGALVLAITAVGYRAPMLRRLEVDVPDADGVPEAPDRPSPGTLDAGLDRGGRAPALALLAFVLAAGGGALLLERPPGVDDAPGDGFSVERARRHVEAIAARPHPTGSPAQAQARDELVARLSGLGLETEVQHAHDVRPNPRLVSVVTVDNIVARLRGREGPPAVLLAAHYDSVPTSPGASDNGAAVAALVETARVLAQGPAPRHDVIFFFPDAEEIGRNGARAFIAQHPWAREVGVVVNFDARGHGGPVYMFQTGAANGAWIRRFIAAAPSPRASSLLNQIYQRLPNDTDFTAFLEAGYPGFNLAFIEGLTHYHTALDRPEEVAAASIAHQGSYAVGLARGFAELDLAEIGLAEPREPDRAYFNVLGGWMISYPRWLAGVSAALASALFLAVLALGLRRRRLSAFGLWQSVLAVLGMAVAIPVAVTLLWFVLRDACGLPVVMGSTRGAGLFMSGFACLTAAAFAALHRFFAAMVGALNLAMGALAWWWILALAASGPWLPVEANFLFVWPLAASALGVGYLCLTPPAAVRPWRLAAVLAAAAVPALLLVGPFIATIYVGLQSLFELGGAALLLEILLLGLLTLQIGVWTSGGARWPAATAAAGVIFLALGVAAATAGPKLTFDSVLYAYDADSGERSWFSLDPAPDDWTRQFGFERGATAPFKHFFPLVPVNFMRSDAPAAAVPPPELAILEARTLGERFREARVGFHSPSQVAVRAIWFEPADAVASVAVHGRTVSFQEVGVAGQPPVIQVTPVAAEEEITVRIRGAAPVTMVVTDQYDGLPELPGIAPRLPGFLPRPLFSTVRSDVTLVRRSLIIAAPESP